MEVPKAIYSYKACYTSLRNSTVRQKGRILFTWCQIIREETTVLFWINTINTQTLQSDRHHCKDIQYRCNPATVGESGSLWCNTCSGQTLCNMSEQHPAWRGTFNTLKAGQPLFLEGRSSWVRYFRSGQQKVTVRWRDVGTVTEKMFQLWSIFQKRKPSWIRRSSELLSYCTTTEANGDSCNPRLSHSMVNVQVTTCLQELFGVVGWVWWGTGDL